MVQRSFHPESDGTCHVYVLHPPGGVAGGDRLDIDVRLDAGARALLTTPGATKFYRMQDATGVQSVRIDVGAGAVCEYLPQSTILFDGAQVRMDLHVDLAEGSTFVGWDFICLGRPAAGERFTQGGLRLRTQVLRAGLPLWFERQHLDAGSRVQEAAFALAGQPVFGALIYAGPLAQEAASHVRAAIGEAAGAPDAGGVFSVSQLEDLAVCRYLGPKVREGQAFFLLAWNVLRRMGQNKAASAPRIWAT